MISSILPLSLFHPEKDLNARSLRMKGRSGVSLGPDGRFFMQPNAFFGPGERQNSGWEVSNGVFEALSNTSFRSERR
ncbi:hypothetical protein [Reinekea sp. G2M2-21]|uniref:hypothetical protein n=1 Tax=Reinekea sp. G2M2-21 TaxID=2788942 RepID=UPI0018ABAB9C|nr:hypothetical protein [Reinekea sp. G2M2-21]